MGGCVKKTATEIRWSSSQYIHNRECCLTCAEFFVGLRACCQTHGGVHLFSVHHHVSYFGSHKGTKADDIIRIIYNVSTVGFFSSSCFDFLIF